MTLNELIAEVYLITNRPDLVNETSAAVRAATLKVHQSDFYAKDLAESGVDFLNSAFIQQLDYRTLFPRWRALKYLRKTDVVGSDTLGLFEVIVPEQVLDDYSINKTNVCYLAGTVLQIRSSTSFRYGIIGYYKNPNITVPGYDSWIALDHPFAIIYEAASKIFKQTGDNNTWTTYTQEAAVQIAEIRMANILAQGY